MLVYQYFIFHGSYKNNGDHEGSVINEENNIKFPYATQELNDVHLYKLSKEQK